MDSNISHSEFALIDYGLKEYDETKQEMKQ